MKLPCLFLLAFTISACTAEPGSENPVENSEQSVSVEIPEHLQNIENLTAYPANTEPSHSIELVQEQIFQETDSLFFQRISGAKADVDGNVLLSGFLDLFNFFIHAYQPDGTYLSPVGRHGSGPGQYRSFNDLLISDELVYVLDFIGRRVNVYSLDDYSLVREFLYNDWDVFNEEAVNGLSLSGFYPRNDGDILAVFRGRSGNISSDKMMIINSDGEALSDVILELKNEQMFQGTGFGVTLQFKGRSLYDVSDNGSIYAAWTENFLIRKYDAQGNYQSAFYFPLEGKMFDSDEYFEANRELITPSFENSIEDAVDFPDTWPVLQEMFVDDENRLWVATAMEDEQMYQWWILEDTGALIAKLNRGRDQPISDVKNGFMYSREIEDDTGLNRIVKYRIQLTDL